MSYDPWATLQQFADGGGEGSGTGGDAGGQAAAPSGAEASPDTGVSPADAGQDRLRELGVPEDVLRRRSERNKGRLRAPAAQEAPAAPQPSSAAPEARPEEKQEVAEPTLNELMEKHPGLKKEVSGLISKRVKGDMGAAETLAKLAPTLSLYARQQGIQWDPANPDYDAFNRAAQDDDSLYEGYALEHGCTTQEAKERVQQDIVFDNHIRKLKSQAVEMAAKYPGFDLATEMKDRRFMAMTSPGGGLSLDDAYWAIHRDQLLADRDKRMTADMTDKITASIRSGSRRPSEAGAQSQAPASTDFRYSSLSHSDREAFKANLERAWGRGQKVYPGRG